MESKRFDVLDGWRGISILLVLATHLLPLGPKDWYVNIGTGLLGMVLFFILSGFLVTHFLLNHSSVVDFIARRFFRVVPLAWTYLILVLSLNASSFDTWSAHLFFYANLPPDKLMKITAHMWSLCVEMQFYVGVALIFAFFKKRGLLLIPLLCIGFTLLRVAFGQEFSVITYFRIDEILAGCVLALIYNDKLGQLPRVILEKINWLIVLLLLLIASHPLSGFMNYFRPYLAAILVGSTIFNPNTRLASSLNNRVLFYIASISFALYVIHPLLASTWLGSGDLLEKYSKRPLLFVLIFLFAHISTFYFESKWIAFGKQFSIRLRRRAMEVTAS